MTHQPGRQQQQQQQQQQHCHRYHSWRPGLRHSPYISHSWAVAGPATGHKPHPRHMQPGVNLRQQGLGLAAHQGGSAAGTRSVHSTGGRCSQQLVPLEPESGQQLLAQLDSCRSVAQLQHVLDHNLHLMDARCLAKALDVVVDGVAALRGDTLLTTTCWQLGQLFMRLLPSLPAREATAMLHSFAMLRYNPAGNEEGLLAVCAHLEHVVFPELLLQHAFTDMGNALWALASISHHGELALDKHLFAQALPLLTAYVPSMPLSMMSKVATAYASLGEDTHHLMELIRNTLEKRLEAQRPFEPASTANILKALAVAKAPASPALLGFIAQHIIARSPGLRLHHVVLLAKCFAVFKYGERFEDEQPARPVQTFWEHVSGFASRHRHQLTPQQLQDLAYAFALRKLQDDMLFTVLSERARELIDKGGFRPVNLSILLWAFARQGRTEDVRLYEAACAHIQRNYTKFTIQNLANSVWALACLGYHDAAFMNTIAAHLKQLLQDPDGRSELHIGPDRVETYVIPGKCDLVRQYTDPHGNVWQDIQFKSGNKVTRELAKGVQPRQYVAQNLTDLAWAFAQLGYTDPELFTLLTQRATGIMDNFSLTSVVDLSWALCKAKCTGPAVQDMFARMEAMLLDSHQLYYMGLDYLSEVLFAMAQLGHDASDTFLREALNMAHSKWERRSSEDTLVRLVYAFYTLGALDRIPDHALNRRIQEFIPMQAAQQTPGADQSTQITSASEGGVPEAF